MTEPRPRFLAPLARVGDGHGYVDRPEQAMTDEPEALGPAIVDPMAELNRTYDMIRHNNQIAELREARRQLTAEQRIADLRRRAKNERHDLSHEFYILRKMLDRGQRDGAMKRIERHEEFFDRPRDLGA